MQNTGLEVKKYPSNTLLAGVVGSRAYGMNTQDSDTDTLGVFAANSKDVLGLRSEKVINESKVYTSPDAVFHEIGKFCRLALAANPTILELLYLDKYQVQNEQGKKLVLLREEFLSSQKVFNSYGGYARSQAARLVSRSRSGKEGFGTVPVNRIAKHGRHCMRLLLQGEQLLLTGNLNLHVGQQRERLFAAGELAVKDIDSYNQVVDKEFKKLENALENTVLSPVANVETVNEFLVNTRELQLSRLLKVENKKEFYNKGRGL